MPHREPGERALPTLAEVPHPRGPRGKRAARREHVRQVRERGDTRGCLFEWALGAQRRAAHAWGLEQVAEHRRRGDLTAARGQLWNTVWIRVVERGWRRVRLP